MYIKLDMIPEKLKLDMYTNNKTKNEMLKQMNVPHSLKKRQNADNCTLPVSQTTVYCTASAQNPFCAVMHVCVDFKVIVYLR